MKTDGFSKRGPHGNSYYEKEEVRPYYHAQLMYKYLISHTSGSAKRIGNLISAFEKADSPLPHLPRKGSRLAKSQCILQNGVYE
jgi:hypothetical protein